ncbi:hypothetical protein FRC04_008565 [Tulasnella sp. 424]|nr:hypothetical protein FRC04_008565 [Tulasnella sp. 424]KAG8974036.1 hypothetical protein FRC05_007952 [Tulasnella sp. 425]
MIAEGQKLMVDAFLTPNNGLVGFQVPGTPWSPGSPQWMPTLSLQQCCKSSSQSLQWTPPTDTAPSASSRWKAVRKTAGSIADGNLEAQATASFALGSPLVGLSASSPSGLARALHVYTV